MHYLSFMVINARYFERCIGIVFVVKYADGQKAEGVFKTVAAAIKLSERIAKNGGNSEVRVGKFNDNGDIETF